jgi:hypothetical protein
MSKRFSDLFWNKNYLVEAKEEACDSKTRFRAFTIEEMAATLNVSAKRLTSFIHKYKVDLSSIADVSATIKFHASLQKKEVRFPATELRRVLGATENDWKTALADGLDLNEAKSVVDFVHACDIRTKRREEAAIEREALRVKAHSANATEADMLAHMDAIDRQVADLVGQDVVDAVIATSNKLYKTKEGKVKKPKLVGVDAVAKTKIPKGQG